MSAKLIAKKQQKIQCWPKVHGAQLWRHFDIFGSSQLLHMSHIVNVLSINMRVDSSTLHSCEYCSMMMTQKSPQLVTQISTNMVFNTAAGWHLTNFPDWRQWSQDTVGMWPGGGKATPWPAWPLLWQCWSSSARLVFVSGTKNFI